MIARLVLGAAVVGSILLSSCGGDDRADDASDAFCARLQALEAEAESMTDDERDAAFLTVVSELAAAAPDPDIAAAIGQLAEVAERLDGLDENDPDAFGEVFAMMFDPELLSAMEQLETYLVETCGFEDTTSADSTGRIVGDDVEIDFDEDAYEEIRDDFDRLRGLLEPHIEGNFGYGLSRFMGAPEIQVDVDLDLNDPLEVCESVAATFDELLSASGLAVTVNDRDEFEPVATRAAGGACALD